MAMIERRDEIVILMKIVETSEGLTERKITQFENYVGVDQVLLDTCRMGDLENQHQHT